MQSAPLCSKLGRGMPINSDRPHLWKADIQKSVDLFNTWFVRFAPKAHRESRVKTTKNVEGALSLTRNLAAITPEVLKGHPYILPALRMATCPPLARDRLIGLSDARKSLVLAMEGGKLTKRMPAQELTENLARICGVITRMLDV